LGLNFMIASSSARKRIGAGKGKPHTIIGIEFDSFAIRAVRVNHGAPGGYKIDALCEERGDFSNDENLLEGLRKVKSRLNVGTKEKVVTALAGKQIWAGEIQFRMLPPEEMIPALRLEVRKTLHFEASGSSLDYELLAKPEEGQELAKYLVVSAHNSIMQRQMALLERSGLEVTVVEVLPVAIANAMWAQVGNLKTEAPHVGLHFGGQVCTVVIDGEKSPFFNRSIYFLAEEVYGKTDTLTERERERRLHILGEEIVRTLAYYEKNSLVSGFSGITLMGDYANEPGLLDLVQNSTGIKPNFPDIIARLGYHAPADPVRFAVSLALALREDA
jgi:Tfp pilus assembly PilM family ATPase